MTKKESRTIQAEFQFDDNNTPRIPATKLMKTVASKTKNMKNMIKAFSPEEIEEIMARRDDGDELYHLSLIRAASISYLIFRHCIMYTD